MNIKDVFKNEELRTFIFLFFMAVLLICVNLSSIYGYSEELFRHVFFTSASAISTTGFFTINSHDWPLFSRVILLSLITIGACTGSTAGGLKISRILMLAKSTLKEIKKSVQPRRVIRIQEDLRPINDPIIQSVQGYVVLYVFFLFISWLVISAFYPSFEGSLSMTIALLNNCGSGLGNFNPFEEINEHSFLVKMISSFIMIAGRLEIIPIFVIFYPNTWKKN